MNNFLPIYQFTKLKGIPKQVVYRWLREKKLKRGEYKLEKVFVKRLRIKKDAILPPYHPRKKII